MKQTTKAALFGAILALAAAVFIAPLILAHDAQAAGQGGGGLEQYKIVSSADFYQVGTTNHYASLEQELNRLATDGWRVRASVGTAIILVK